MRFPDVQERIGHPRLRAGGLVRGQIWLNGYNVGRYWQVGPQEDSKLPLSWLAEQNELLLLAEAGEAAEIALLTYVCPH